jgi:hypothetical protein
MAPGSIYTVFHFLLNLLMAQYARVLHYTREESLARDKHSSFLDPFISYDKN